MKYGVELELINNTHILKTSPISLSWSNDYHWSEQELLIIHSVNEVGFCAKCPRAKKDLTTQTGTTHVTFFSKVS